MRALLFLSSILAFVFTSCTSATDESASTLKAGLWKAEILLNNEVYMPFTFEVSSSADTVWLVNGKERLVLTEVQHTTDSVMMRMHIFNAEIRAARHADSLTGWWIKNDYPDYRLPFRASLTPQLHFPVTTSPVADLSGTWEVAFERKDKAPMPAVGVFEQQGHLLAGTFLTTTGDYRFLSGVVNGNTLHLSCFDGEHAYLFEANIADGQTLTNGIFWSGRSWKQSWSARRNDQASLPSADSLTFMKDGYERLTFSFPDMDGKMVSVDDEKFRGKVVIVQLLGSWCPNCMDETAFLAPYYRQNQKRGLEIIGLAFERSAELEKARPRIETMRKRFDIGYELLLAGPNDKDAAARALPALNHVLAFPTTIFIDRQGKVRKIHTGFSGPGTGKYYEEFVASFHALMDELLAETL